MPIALLLILALLFVPAAKAQQAPDVDSVPYFSIYHEATLSSSAAAWTIQVPSRNASRVQLVSTVVTCTAAATLILEDGNGGTAATSTALTAINNNKLGATATATVYHTSNAGAGTTVNKYPLTANTPYPLAMEFTQFPKDRTGVLSYNLRTSTVTGTCSLFMLWKEKSR